MSSEPSDRSASSVRAVMGPRRPAGVGKIEKARDPRHALVRLLPYLSRFKGTLLLTLVFILIYTVLG
jgi:hypothetical protein